MIGAAEDGRAFNGGYDQLSQMIGLFTLQTPGHKAGRKGRLNISESFLTGSIEAFVGSGCFHGYSSEGASRPEIRNFNSPCHSLDEFS